MYTHTYTNKPKRRINHLFLTYRILFCSHLGWKHFFMAKFLVKLKSPITHTKNKHWANKSRTPKMGIIFLFWNIMIASFCTRLHTNYFAFLLRCHPSRIKMLARVTAFYSSHSSSSSSLPLSLLFAFVRSFVCLFHLSNAVCFGLIDQTKEKYCFHFVWCVAMLKIAFKQPSSQSAGWYKKNLPRETCWYHCALFCLLSCSDRGCWCVCWLYKFKWLIEMEI